jgi:hypothetical protein
LADYKDEPEAGRVRLLFVADSIPVELRRIVEFLNQQMDPAEVLALELRQYEGAGMKTLVPLLYGQTEEAQEKKRAGTPPREWTEEEIYARLEQRGGSEWSKIGRKIVGWMREAGADVSFGRGTNDVSIRFGFEDAGHRFNPIKLWSTGAIEVAFRAMLNSSFKDETRRRHLMNRLNAIEGLNWPYDAIGRYPSIPLKLLTSQLNLTRFLESINWFLTELHRARAGRRLPILRRGCAAS